MVLCVSRGFGGGVVTGAVVSRDLEAPVMPPVPPKILPKAPNILPRPSVFCANTPSWLFPVIFPAPSRRLLASFRLCWVFCCASWA